MALDYLAYQNSVKNPFESAIQGFQTGSKLVQDRQDRQFQMQQREMAIKDYEAKQEEAEAYKKDMADFQSIENKTPDDYRDLFSKRPELEKALKESMEDLTEEQKENHIKEANKLYFAISSGNLDHAKEILENNLKAAENSGDKKSIDSAKVKLKSFEISPEMLRDMAGAALSANDSNFAKNFGPNSNNINKPKVSVKDWENLASTSLNIDKGVMGEVKYRGVLGSISSEIQEYAAELYKDNPQLSPQAASNMAAKEIWVDSGLEKLFKNKDTLFAVDPSYEGTEEEKRATPQDEFLKVWRDTVKGAKEFRKLKKSGKYKPVRRKDMEDTPKNPTDKRDPANISQFFGL